MKSTIFDMERGIARCRAIFSAIAILTIYVDPRQPMLTRWLPLTGGLFAMDPYVRTVLFSHLAYSVAIYLVLVRRIAPPRRVAQISTWTDVLFGAAIVLVTEGTTSAFSAFFAFAVLTAGMREGMRATLVVTAVSVTLYLAVILAFAPASETQYLVMRPAYLAITGYLVGYLGEARLNQEARSGSA